MAEITEYQWAAVRRISQDHVDAAAALRTLGPLMPLRVDAGIHSDTVASIVSDIAQSIAHTTIYIEQIGERIDEALAATETMEDNLAAEFLRFANGEATGG